MDVAQAGQGTAEPRPGGKGDVGRGGAARRVFPVFAPGLGGGFTGVTGEARPKILQNKVYFVFVFVRYRVKYIKIKTGNSEMTTSSCHNYI